MRCGRAQKLITTALDGELGGRRQRALDQHLAGCPACQRERETTGTLLRAVAGLPAEAAVPAALEYATLRRMRHVAAEEHERAQRRSWSAWLGLPTIAVAAAAVVAIAIGLSRRGAEPVPPSAVASAPAPADVRVARREKPAERAPAPVRPAAPDAAVTPEPPPEPPAELAAQPDLFVELPILRNMEKLDHFEAIRTTTVDDPPLPTGAPAPSNG